MLPASHAVDDPSGAGGRAADDENDTGMIGLRRTTAIVCVLAAVVLVVLGAVIASIALPRDRSLPAGRAR